MKTLTKRPGELMYRCCNSIMTKEVRKMINRELGTVFSRISYKCNICGNTQTLKGVHVR